MNKSLEFNYDDMDSADYEMHFTDRETKSLDNITTKHDNYYGFQFFEMSYNFSNFGLI